MTKRITTDLSTKESFNRILNKLRNMPAVTSNAGQWNASYRGTPEITYTEAKEDLFIINFKVIVRGGGSRFDDTFKVTGKSNGAEGTIVSIDMQQDAHTYRTDDYAVHVIYEFFCSEIRKAVRTEKMAKMESIPLKIAAIAFAALLALMIWGIFFNSAPSSSSNDKLYTDEEFFEQITTDGTLANEWYEENYGD